MALRSLGWTLFLVGSAVFVVFGDLTVATVAGKAGIFTMISGMILTSVGQVVHQLRLHRERQGRIKDLKAERERSDRPPAPPDEPNA